MGIQHTHRLCSLEMAIGNAEACPEDACPFWEPGGAALGGRCVFDQVDIARDAALAPWLLEIRAKLEAASSVEDERALRRSFHHLLNETRE